LYQFGDLFELNVKLRCQKVNDGASTRSVSTVQSLIKLERFWRRIGKDFGKKRRTCRERKHTRSTLCIHFVDLTQSSTFI